MNLMYFNKEQEHVWKEMREGMDERILIAILNSCESVTKNLENSKDYKKLLKEHKFLPTSTDIFNALCSSLTKLLSYKVSKEAYQRYTVRLHVINALRDWCRITDTLRDFKILRDEKHTSALLRNLLEKYLTDDILDNCDSSNDLLSLTSALICLSTTSSHYRYYLERVLQKLTELEQCDQSAYLLCYAVQENLNLNLGLSTIESIYESQKCKLIEQPLLHDFMSSCTELNKDDDANNLDTVDWTDQLFDLAGKSSHIFLLLCAFLKELLIQLDYAPKVANFIQSTLKRITNHCETQGKDILDLYPRNLQSLVILLRIEPNYHIDDSRNATLETLQNIFADDKDTVIALLSHYPQWLKLFSELLDSDNIT